MLGDTPTIKTESLLKKCELLGNFSHSKQRITTYNDEVSQAMKWYYAPNRWLPLGGKGFPPI